MPTYQYACQACDEQFEVVQSFSDDSLTTHESGCGGPVRKVFGSVGVVFKGSGFYRTDSRSGAKGESAAASTSEATKDSSSAKSDGSASSSGSSSGSSSSPASTSSPSSTSTSTSAAA